MLSEDSQRLSKTYPDLSALMREREREVATAWKSLLTKSHARNCKLVEAEHFRDLRYAVYICDVCVIVCICVCVCVCMFASQGESKGSIKPPK